MIDFVAEIPGPYQQDLARCRRLIRAAARAGCAGVVCDYFRVERLFASQVLKVSPSLRQRRRHEMPRHFFTHLSACAHEHGLKFGATPCDLDAVDEIRDEVDFWSVSSYALPWLDIIHHCAESGLPLLLGTGMADAGEVWSAVETALESGCTDLTVLHTVEGRPTPEEDCNLAAIGTLREMLVREFTPLYPDAALKAGWRDGSISAGVIARAVNHWGCDVVSFPLDLTDRDSAFADTPCWLPDHIAAVIAGGYLPVRRESDGTGRIAPDPSEQEERLWRADPGDGLRPSAVLRKSWPTAQSEATRSGPDVYLVPGGDGVGRLARCLALAESLRDEHDADVLFLIQGTLAQVRSLERCGFNWTRCDGTENLVAQVAFLNNITAEAGPPVCVLDLPEPSAAVAAELRRLGMLTVAIDDTADEELDLGIVPSFGWQCPQERTNLIGGSEYVLVRSDVAALRSRRETSGGVFPRVLVDFGAHDPDDLTMRAATALHATLSQGAVQVIVHADADPDGLTASLLASRFPGYEIIPAEVTGEILLATADLVITDLSQRVDEALSLGVPVLLLAKHVADAEASERLAASGAAIALGSHDDLTEIELTAALKAVLGDADRLSQLRFEAQELAAGVLDGEGPSRAAARIMQLVRSRGETSRGN
jgi:N-acetylneuraminate synthase